jgi:hypothetical protein
MIMVLYVLLGIMGLAILTGALCRHNARALGGHDPQNPGSVPLRRCNPALGGLAI